MAGLNAKFVLLKDTVSIHDSGHGDNPDGILLPAGCLVQEISESNDPATDQLLLQSLDHATGGSFFIHASLDDLLEVSAFSSSLLLAEKELKMRLIVCRDENWLEEATHMFEDTNVFVSVGRAQFLGVIRFAGEMEDRVGRWFGVEIQSSLLVNVENMVGGGDGFPEFECEFGRGLYVTISSVRLAEPVLDMPFRGRAAGKKGFSARTLRAAGSKKMKMDSRAQQNEKENGGVKSDQNVVNGFLDFEWKNERGLEVDDRVVWFDNQDGPARGTVRYIGRINSKDEKIRIAVEFDEKVGVENYTGMTNGFGQFSIKSGYGRLLDSTEVMNEVDFGYEPRVDPQSEIENKTSKNEFETSIKEVAKPPTMEFSEKPTTNFYEQKPKSQFDEEEHKSATELKNATEDISDLPVIRLGSRVVWFKSKEEIIRGLVCFMGEIGEENTVQIVGVRLDERKGPDNFIGKYLNKDLFHCGPGYGTVTGIDSLMDEKQYDATFGIAKLDVLCTRVDATQVQNHRVSICLPQQDPVRQISVPLKTSPTITVDHHSYTAPSLTSSLTDHPLQRPRQGPFPQLDPQNMCTGQRAYAYFGSVMVMGVIKWIGRPHFKPSEVHVGMQLLQYTEGAPGGTIEGFDYFEALAGFGVIIPLAAVHSVISNPSMNSVSSFSGVGLKGFSPLRPRAHKSHFDRSSNQILHSKKQQQRNEAVGSFTAPLVQPPTVIPPISTNTLEYIGKAVQEADLKERATNERMNHVAVFVLQSEDQGIFDVTVDNKDRTKGFVKFLLKPSPETEPYFITRVTLPVMNGGGDGQIEMPINVTKNIEFFPPFFLGFHLTEGFPEHLPPVYTVDCNWITDVQVGRLRDHLVGIWRENRKDPNRNILIESLWPLKSTLLRIMGLEFGTVYISKPVAEFEVADSHLPAGRCLYETDKEVMEAFSRLAKFNDKECKDRDEKQKYECSICTSAVSPNEISFFSTFCMHQQMFCKDCISNHVKAQVEDGNTTEIKCMGDGCQVLSTIHDLADLINPKIFEEISRHLNNQLLDKMADTRKCPVCECAVIFEHAMIGNERYITCPGPDCGIQYCPHCRDRSHGEQPCLTTEQKRELRNQFFSASNQEEKDDLIRKFGKENIDHAIEDYQAEEYIRTHGKPCPTCKTPIEKISGCNHMSCRVRGCNTEFCYACGGKYPGCGCNGG